jgi:hypothetical protein
VFSFFRAFVMVFLPSLTAPKAPRFLPLFQVFFRAFVMVFLPSLTAPKAPRFLPLFQVFFRVFVLSCFRDGLFAFLPRTRVTKSANFCATPTVTRARILLPHGNNCTRPTKPDIPIRSPRSGRAPVKPRARYRTTWQRSLIKAYTARKERTEARAAPWPPRPYSRLAPACRPSLTRINAIPVITAPSGEKRGLCKVLFERALFDPVWTVCPPTTELRLLPLAPPGKCSF